MNELINLFDFEKAALERMPAGPRDYFRGGAHDELTLRDNHAAFECWQIHYRVLRNVAQRELATELLGHRIEWPVLVAPTACHQLAHPEGELATARAAAAVGTAMVLSTISNFAMEDVAREARSGLWFQLYVYRDRGITSDLVARAADCGCRAIALTVDAPVGGVRERDLRNAFAFPSELPLRNVLPSGSEGVVPDVPVSFQQYVNSMFDPSLGWSDLEWLCSRTKLPVLIKGVVRPDDAVRAAEHGARGVIVSNHGGRQLDTAPAALDVLESIAQAVGERLTVLVDGGVRRGTDVLKALALGAQFVFLGRPFFFAAAVGGQAGVAHAIRLLREEIDRDMALLGIATLAEMTPERIIRGQGRN